MKGRSQSALFDAATALARDQAQCADGGIALTIGAQDAIKLAIEFEQGGVKRIERHRGIIELPHGELIHRPPNTHRSGVTGLAATCKIDEGQPLGLPNP